MRVFKLKVRGSKLLILVNLLSVSLFAQSQSVWDDFEDGDLLNPTWSGDVEDFSVTNGKLRLTAPPEVSSSKLSVVISADTDEVVDSFVLDFYVELDFPPSGSNFCALTLSEIEDAAGSGDKIEIRFGGIPGSQDSLTVVFYQNGSPIAEIAGPGGSLGGLTSITRFSLVRNTAGEWFLFADYTGGVDLELQGTAIVMHDFEIELLTINCNYTATRADRFYFDQLMTNTIKRVGSDSECQGVGDSCDDGNQETENDVIDENCICVGELVEMTCDRESDSLALVALYNALNGPEWTNSSEWLSGSPINQWQGVDVVDGCVVRLARGGNNLSGQLPAEIGELSNLEVLSLGGDFTGSIPEEIGQLVNLKTLYLGRGFTGSIPSSIGALRDLEELGLPFNNLSGPFPDEFWQLTKLRILRIGDNDLSGTISPAIQNLRALEFFDVLGNQLEGGLPGEITTLDSLEDIWIADNQFSGSLPTGFGYMPKLKWLYASYNNFSGVIPEDLFESQSVSVLLLEGNNLSGCFPEPSERICSMSFSGNIIHPPAPMDYSYLAGTYYSYSFIGNQQLPYEGDLERVCNGDPQIGAPCDDGNPNTEDDRIQLDCTCGCPELASVQIDTMLCLGDTLRFGEQVITAESGRYELFVQTYLGDCDSLELTWFVEVIGSETIMEWDTICEGSVLDWRGLDLRESGTYTFTETTVGGSCDTLFQLDLTVLTREDFQVVDDAYDLVSSNNAVTLDVPGNDSLPYPYELSIIHPTAKGDVAVNDGVILFTSDGVSSGADSFRYEVCLERCRDFCKQAWVRLDIAFDCELEITTNIPSGFTPNGDGKNDLFDPVDGITGECLDQLGVIRLGIRNSQSELVFTSGDAYVPWDGNDRKGRPLMADTYFYILVAEGLAEPVSGAVELLR